MYYKQIIYHIHRLRTSISKKKIQILNRIFFQFHLWRQNFCQNIPTIVREKFPIDKII